MAEYSPGEHAEAQERMRQHEKGREEAKFYEYFLDIFKNNITRQLYRKDLNKTLGAVDIKTTNLKLSQFEYCDQESLNRQITEGLTAANKMAGTNIPSIRVNSGALANMTPHEFINYIEDLKSSLIK